MKKIWLGILTLAVLLGVLFHQWLIATYFFYDWQREHKGVVSHGTITWETISFTSTARTGSIYPPLSTGEIVVPVPFEAEYSAGDNYFHAQAGARTITLLKAERPDFFATYSDQFSSTEEATVCALLSRVVSAPACADARTFYGAMLELEPSDVGLFADVATKQVYPKLMTIKSKTQTGTVVSKFETEHGLGYLYHLGGNAYSVHFFTDPDTMHPINFTDMEEADVVFVLSNITKQ